jgi:hypothetical protein
VRTHTARRGSNREDREDPVAGRLHDPAAVSAGALGEVPFVATDELTPTPIAHLGGAGGRTHEVREHDGREPVVGLRQRTVTGDEGFQLDQHRLGILEHEHLVGAFELDETSARNRRGEVSAMLNRNRNVLAVVHHHRGHGHMTEQLAHVEFLGHL